MAVPAELALCSRPTHREMKMSKKLRWLAPLVGCLLAPLQAFAAAAVTPVFHASSGLIASLGVVLGLVGVASAGAKALDWYSNRQRDQRHARAALALVSSEAGGVAPLRTALRMAMSAPAVSSAAVVSHPTTAAANATASGRRTQAVRGRRPGLAAVRGISQPSQIGSQFGHLN